MSFNILRRGKAWDSLHRGRHGVNSTGLVAFSPAMQDDRISDQLSDYFSKIGRKGGHARAKTMTPEQRKTSATKASKAAARARSKKAKGKRSK
jgi:hypothetical protein